MEDMKPVINALLMFVIYSMPLFVIVYVFYKIALLSLSYKADDPTHLFNKIKIVFDMIYGMIKNFFGYFSILISNIKKGSKYELMLMTITSLYFIGIYMYYIKDKYNIYQKTKNFFRDGYDSMFNSFEYIKRMNMYDEEEGFDVYKKIKLESEKMYAKHNRYIDFAFIFGGLVLFLLFRLHFKQGLKSGDENISYKENFWNSEINGFKDGTTFSKKIGWLMTNGLNVFKKFFLLIAVIFGVMYLTKYFVEKAVVQQKVLPAAMTLLAVGMSVYIYNHLINKEWVKKIFESSRIFKLIFYFILFVPCLLSEGFKFAAKEMKNTSPMELKILGGQLIFLSGFIIIPMLIKYLYTYSVGDETNRDLLNTKLDSLNERLSTLNDNIETLQQYKIPGSNIISPNSWDDIISKNLNKTSENPLEDNKLKRKLLKYLSDNNYVNSHDDCFNKFGRNAKNASKKGYCDMYADELANYVRDTVPIIMKMEKEQKQIKEAIEKIKGNKRFGILKKGTMIQNQPMSLEKRQNLGDYQNLNAGAIDEEYSYSYSLSSWIYIHGQPENFKESYSQDTNILDYNGKPKITYNMRHRKLKISMENITKEDDIELEQDDYKYDKERVLNAVYKKRIKGDVVFEYDNFLLQKWNNIVVSYANGTLDIFINGELVKSFLNVVPEMNSTSIFSGHNGGLRGYICNVVYYPQYLSLKRIKTNYEALKDVSPPVI